MSVKFSEDVVPLTELKVNPGRVVKHAVEAHRPVLLTSRGRGVAVIQSVSDYEQAAEERAFMRAVVAGLADLDAGREVSLAEAKARFGLAEGMATMSPEQPRSPDVALQQGDVLVELSPQMANPSAWQLKDRRIRVLAAFDRSGQTRIRV